MEHRATLMPVPWGPQHVRVPPLGGPRSRTERGKSGPLRWRVQMFARRHREDKSTKNGGGYTLTKRRYFAGWPGRDRYAGANCALHLAKNVSMSEIWASKGGAGLRAAPEYFWQVIEGLGFRGGRSETTGWQRDGRCLIVWARLYRRCGGVTPPGRNSGNGRSRAAAGRTQ
jgi:hypothetical protein